MSVKNPFKQIKQRTLLNNKKQLGSIYGTYRKSVFNGSNEPDDAFELLFRFSNMRKVHIEDFLFM